MNKRGQAAMEFLMTYGWAILVVLVVIGALAYFGILNPSTLLPERCEFQIGINCKDHLISTDSGSNGYILFDVENGMGQDMRVTNITATTDTFGSSVTCSWDNDTSSVQPELILNGASHSFRLNSSNGGTGTCAIPADYRGRNVKTKWSVVIEWFAVGSNGNFKHKADGQLLAKVE